MDVDPLLVAATGCASWLCFLEVTGLHVGRVDWGLGRRMVLVLCVRIQLQKQSNGFLLIFRGISSVCGTLDIKVTVDPPSPPPHPRLCASFRHTARSSSV